MSNLVFQVEANNRNSYCIAIWLVLGQYVDVIQLLSVILDLRFNLPKMLYNFMQMVPIDAVTLGGRHGMD